MSEQSIARVSFGVRGDCLVPEELSEVIGVSPTSAWRKGDLSPRTRTARSSGVWSLEFEGMEVEEAVLELVRSLQNKRPVISELMKLPGVTVSIGIWWEPEGGQGGYSLPGPLVAEVAAFANRVDFYFASSGNS